MILHHKTQNKINLKLKINQDIGDSMKTGAFIFFFPFFEYAIEYNNIANYII